MSKAKQQEQIVIEQVALGLLDEHPAQMRTVYGLEKMVELTVSMIARGFDVDNPILLRKKGGRSNRYELVRGHRRRIAFVAATYFLQQGWVEDANDSEDELLVSVEDHWRKFSEQFDGDVVKSAEAMIEAGSLSKRTVPAVVRSMTTQESLYALWSDNYGSEEPDLMGQAISFRAGVEAGFSPRQIADQVGATQSKIEGLVALADVDRRLAKRITDGELGVSVAPVLATISNKYKKAAVTEFILAREPHLVMVDRLRRTIREFRDWEGFELPMMFDSQTQRNAARGLVALWHSMLKEQESAVKAWELAFGYFYKHGKYDAPFSDSALMREWFATLLPDDYRPWLQIAETYLTAVSCETCPVHQLPAVQLRDDLMSPLLPCRLVTRRDNVERCIHGLTENDPFHVRVPMSWGDLPGVTSVAGKTYCSSYDELVTAWEAQAEYERSEDEKRAQEEARQRAEAEAARIKSEKDRETFPPPAQTDEDERVVVETAVPEPVTVVEPDVPEAPRPVDELREQIAAYMAVHVIPSESQNIMATNCSACQHRLADEVAAERGTPPCAWADRLRTVQFSQIKPLDGRPGSSAMPPNYRIPVCHQFSPRKPLHETVPEYPSPPSLQRSLMLNQIEWFLGQQPDDGAFRMFQWWTGRPMSATEKYVHWFSNQLKEAQEKMSDGQIFTIYVLCYTALNIATPGWKRINALQIPLPEFSQWFEGYLSSWDVTKEIEEATNE